MQSRFDEIFVFLNKQSKSAGATGGLWQRCSMLQAKKYIVDD